VDAVLSIDLQPLPTAIFFVHVLVDACRTIVLLRAPEVGEIVLLGNRIVEEGEMRGLVMIMVGPGQSHRGQEVKTYFAVGLGIVDRLAVLHGLQLSVVSAMVTQGPGFFATQEPCEEASVSHETPHAQGRIEGGSGIADHRQLLPHPTLLHTLLVAVQQQS